MQVRYFSLHLRARTDLHDKRPHGGLSTLNDDLQEQLGTHSSLAVHSGLEMNIVLWTSSAVTNVTFLGASQAT